MVDHILKPVPSLYTVSCVRIAEMPTCHLATLDQHPLISSSPVCTRIIAHAYLARYVGCTGTLPSSRHSMEAGSAGRDDMCLEGHDVGQHEEDVLGCEAQLGPSSSWDLPGSPASKRQRTTACRGSPGGIRRALVLA